MADGIHTRLRERAESLGFTLFGVAPATDADGFGRFADWLDAGYAGEMSYLHDHREQRRHPRSVVETVKSVVMLGYEYAAGVTPLAVGSPPPGSSVPLEPTSPAGGEMGRFPLPPKGDETNNAPPPPSWGRSMRPKVEAGGGEPTTCSDTRHPTPDTRGRVARYALGPDYHRFIWDKVNELSVWLMAEVPGCFAHGVSDTAPILERDFARRAGLGWFGKNTMLINKHRGSFFFLSAFLTDLEVPASEPHTGSHCGTCTACLDACPTQAFPEPGVLDARKCISYLTIELRGSMPEELREGVGDWLFGCDVCQDVCPWNRSASLPLSGTGRGSGGEVSPSFPTRPDLLALNPAELLSLSPAAFKERFKGTSLLRARRTGLLRNACVVLGNTGDAGCLAALDRAAEDDDEVIRETATWAAARVRQRCLTV